MFETKIIIVIVWGVISAAMAIVGGIYGYKLPTEYNWGRVENTLNCGFGAVVNALFWPVFITQRLVDDSCEFLAKRVNRKTK